MAASFPTQDKIQLHNKKQMVGWDYDNNLHRNISVDDQGVLNVNAQLGDVSIDGADGAILDGTDANIKAAVLDLAGSNGLAVAIVDASGNQVTSFGGGTQYTEDAAAAANPVGTVQIMVRTDSLSSSEVSADGDNIAARATSKGEQYVKHADKIGSTVADGDNAALGVTTDTAVTGDNTGTVSAKLRGQNKVLADVWDSTNHRLKVNVENSTLAVTQSGTWTVQPGNTANTVAWKVDGSAVTQPVSGTVAVTGVATATKQSDGSQKTQIVDGSGNVIGATSNALDINIKSGNPTSITANAGTNLNTSALALESGGNLATIAGAVRAEDVASADGHTGIPALAVRKGTPANTSGTDGDYEMLQISAGRLWVDASGKTLTVDGSGVTQPVSGTVAVTNSDLSTIAGAIKAEDAAHSSGHTGIMPLAVRSDSGGSLSGTDGDYSPLQVDANGALRVTGGGGGTQYTEDAAAASDPVGNAVILVRKDTPAGITSADGDNIAQRGTDYGAAYVTLLDTSGNPVSVGGGTQYTEDAAAAANPVGTMQIFRRKDTLSSSEVSADGDNIAANATAKGELYVKHVDAVPVTDNSGSLTVDNGGTFVVQENGAALTSLQLIDDTVFAEDAASSNGDKGIQVLTRRTDTAAATAGTDGDYQPFITDSSGRLHVNVGNTVTVGSHAVTNAGTFAVQAATAGDVAHDGADSGNPVKIGARARSSEISAVANNDRSDLITDLVGKLITLPYANPENFVSGAITSAMTGTTSTSLVAAPGAGLRNYITTIIVSNAHATVGTDVAIQDGSGGTTLLTIPAAALYGGAVINLPVPLRQPTTNTALYCANVTTGASTKVSAVGYKGA